jgi:hypothetical protein
MTTEAPTNTVPRRELPSELRDVGMANWLREPLDDAVDRRVRAIRPPSAATMGTPLQEARSYLVHEVKRPDTIFMMGDNPALPKMPEKPTLADFFRLRFDTFDVMHLLQSAYVARKNDMPETVVIACLLHDIAIAGLLSSNHGYWGAQMVAPYVDEEVRWAIEKHEALRYFADESAGYSYPQAYIEYFGADYVPPPHHQREHDEAKKHKWYMTSRLVTINDIYSFDPNVTVTFDQFEDLVGRHFKQPKEGLGFDGSPSAHMWRTMIWPNNFL